LGLKHATEADHVAAISTLVSERRSIRQSALVGALWGVGHTGALLVAGFFILGLGLGIPERMATLLELAVAVMIFCLGMRLLFREPHRSDHGPVRGLRPFLVGVVHGLAGSAALTLLVLTQIVQDGGTGFAFAYLVVFGAGSVGGMLLMSSVISIPFSFGPRLFRNAIVPLRLLTALLSMGFGVFYAWATFEKLAIF
jgi:hypothetical protein